MAPEGSELLEWPPRLAIYGYSGSGKTTLCQELVGRFLKARLMVVLIKHDAHRLSIDREGKDTDVLFRAGADIAAHDQVSAFVRVHGQQSLEAMVERVGSSYDLILVEGHKTVPGAKLWLMKDGETEVPEEVTEVMLSLPRGERIDHAFAFITSWLRERHTAQISSTAILPGVKSGPGAGCLTVVSDGDASDPPVALPGATSPVSELALLMTALRWRPHHRWYFLHESLLDESAHYCSCLCEEHVVGTWATCIGEAGGPLRAACIDPPLLPLLERAVSTGVHEMRQLGDGCRLKWLKNASM